MTLSIIQAQKSLKPNMLIRMKPGTYLVACPKWRPGVETLLRNIHFVRVEKVLLQGQTQCPNLYGQIFRLSDFCAKVPGYMDRNGHHPTRYALSELKITSPVKGESYRNIRAHADTLEELLCYVNVLAYQEYWKTLFTKRLEQGVAEILSEIPHVKAC